MRGSPIFELLLYLFGSRLDAQVRQSIRHNIPHDRRGDDSAELNPLRIVDRHVNDQLRIVRRSETNERYDMLVRRYRPFTTFCAVPVLPPTR